jgi:spermidine/putrescine transport system permease protein
MKRRISIGTLTMLPVGLLLLTGFLVPIGIVAAYSFMPPRTFALTGNLTGANYEAALMEGYWRPLMWSTIGALVTTLICLVLAWPTAKALDRFVGRWATFATLLIALPIFISESVRLFGMSLFLMPGGGILAGSLDALFGVSIGTILNTHLAALLGLIYVHFPFVLFPLLLGFSLIPREQVEAARDLGASGWQVFREIEAPLTAPGAAIGALFCFGRKRRDEHTRRTGRDGRNARNRTALQLRAGLATRCGADDARHPDHGTGRAADPAPHQSRQADQTMSWRATRATRSLQAMWLTAVLILLYIPILSVVLASLANTRYMRFPHKVWTLDAYREALGTYTTATLHVTSLKIALVVVALSVVLAVFGALAFARYDWRGRSWFRRFLLLPVFFPQPVLGLALLLSFTAAGIAPTWQTAAFAHLVWIVPIVTLVISIRLYSYDVMQEEAAFDLGATRLQVFREVTLPALAPGVVSGALFAFLLSWSNLPLSIYTTGADTTLPEWLFSRTATNYSPLVPAVAVIATGISAAFIALGAIVWAQLRRRAV